MLVNALDIFLLLTGIGGSIYFRVLKYRGKSSPRLHHIVILATTVLYLAVFPYLAWTYEISRVTSTWQENSVHDGFELLYTYFRLPTYWVVMIAMLLIQNLPFWRNRIAPRA